MQYGVDVASTRLDDLDKRVLTDVRERVGREEMISVLDVGCGQGGLAVALVAAGAAVTAIDITDYSWAFQNETAARVRFVQTDVREWVQNNTAQFDLVVLQRILHYLPYHDAKQLLIALRGMTDTLYLSVTGTTTAIASHYGKVSEPLESRWGVLDTVGQELFSITAPMCLYTEAELRTLLDETGWEIEWLRVSDFGNIKVVAIKRS
jgi:2-polyprenyl-3-methyl-5-hydroxy-6-metoxy-1,4-benzoquinol methylase